MKISHEVPISLLKESRKFNDYDYCLDFLFERKDYIDFYKESLKMGREVLFDNGAFEYGENMPDPSVFYEHIKELNPTSYIVTDYLDDKNKTLNGYFDWINKYKNKLKSKCIASIQGKTVKELEECYKEMSESGADKIAITFDSKAYDEIADMFLNQVNKDYKSYLYKWCFGRRWFIQHLINKGIWNWNIPHHLLGCSLAYEYSLYRGINIETGDTSSPIVHAIHNIEYSEDGNSDKPSIKLCDLIDHNCSKEELELIDKNVKKFRKLISNE